MARNGSGTYSTPNSFSSGTTISSSAMNANFTDVASEITNSLPRDGQAAMTGQLQATAGSATAPGLAFSGDTNTGVFRKAADTLGFSAGGTEIASATSTAFTITGLTASSASLTTPTIAGATLSGTLAGTPTFSGAVTFGAAPTLSDGLTVSAGTVALPAGSIETADLADSAVTTGKLNDSAVTAAKVAAGAVVAVSYAETTATPTNSTTLPIDDTVPTSSEGTEVVSVSHTPASASNYLIVEALVFMEAAVADNFGFALFDGTTCIQATAHQVDVLPETVCVGVRYQAGSTSAKTISFRVGANAARNWYLNKRSGGRLFGGAAKSWIKVTEVKG